MTSGAGRWPAHGQIFGAGALLRSGAPRASPVVPAALLPAAQLEEVDVAPAEGCLLQLLRLLSNCRAERGRSSEEGRWGGLFVHSRKHAPGSGRLTRGNSAIADRVVGFFARSDVGFAAFSPLHSAQIHTRLFFLEKNPSTTKYPPIRPLRHPRAVRRPAGGMNKRHTRQGLS